MNCPKCGNRLAWDDGAFCKLCMDIANEKSRQLQIAKKVANKSLALRRSKETPTFNMKMRVSSKMLS